MSSLKMLHDEISRSSLHSVNWRSTEFSGVLQSALRN